MKKCILVIIMLTSLVVYSQKQGNIWYFGGDYTNQSSPGAGLDFNTSPPSFLLNTGMGYTEGCAAYCNSIGQLLFYTNGMDVYNKNHSVMSNGDSIGGHWSTAQSTIVVPVSDDTNKYYVFSNDGLPTSNGSGLYYAIINMRYNNGLGEVVSKLNHLVSGTGEQLTGTYHANGTDFWIVTYIYNSSRFYAYRVHSLGVDSPVISNFGLTSDFYGNIEMSPKGNKMAIKGWVSPSVNGRYLLDFDNSTGVISNPYFLFSGGSNYGFSFSPDGNLFYAITDNDSLVQYDLNSPSIIASAILIGHKGAGISLDMEIGPDKKIYIPNNSSFLTVINYPDIHGYGCNIQINALTLGGRNSGYQLPNVTLIANLPANILQSKSDLINVTISPNPFDDYTTISFENPKNKCYTITIYDSRGEKRRIINDVRSDKVQIERNNLEGGLYLYEIGDGERILSSGKLIIK